MTFVVHVRGDGGKPPKALIEELVCKDCGKILQVDDSPAIGGKVEQTITPRKEQRFVR